MRISEAAAETGFTPDTIRWYEKIGLIELDRTSRNSNNYRQYDQGTIEKLLQIKQMKSFGFSLLEVRQLLDLIRIDDLNCENVGDIIDPKLSLIDQKIAELQSLKSKLMDAKARCSGACIELFED